jgi:hypothetical protein
MAQGGRMLYIWDGYLPWAIATVHIPLKFLLDEFIHLNVG